LRLHAIGCPDKIIALRVGVSERTVRFHIAEAIKRLGAYPAACASAAHVGSSSAFDETENSWARPGNARRRHV